MLESSGTQFVRGLPLFLLARRDEIMKCYFTPWPNGVASRPKLRALRAEAWHARSDDAPDLSIPVSGQFQLSDKMQFSTLRDLAKVLEMFKYSEFDLERTTTKSAIIVYISLDFLL